MARARFVLALLFAAACAPAKPPPLREVVHLHGSPYERGLQHGQLLKSKIHSLYTTLLTNSLFPYLSRERDDLASFLPEYADDRYANGQFAYQAVLDSAKSVERSLPRAVRDELHGIADGSGLEYDEVLVLNTFVDTVLALRGIALSIRLARGPHVESVELLGAATDGVDNDGDGVADQPGEGLLSPYAPPLFAAGVELPPDVRVAVVLRDPDGVDRAALRVRLDDALYTDGSDGLTVEDVAPDTLRLTLAPGALAPGTHTLVVSAADRQLLQTPPPAHENVMRDEELAFTIRGTGLAPRDVRRPVLRDGRTRPPTLAFGLRGSATAGGAPLIAQHFALLDANTAHKHGVVFVHHPDGGPPFAYVGWAGVAYGYSGLSQAGVGYACNPSDTLDNSVVGSVLEQVADLAHARLLARGVPMGFVGRRILETAADAEGARAVMAGVKHVYGWSCVLADARGGLQGVDVDSDVFKEGSDGVYAWSPGDLDAQGRPYSSVRGDDVETSSTYRRNAVDVGTFTLAGQRVQPQRGWSSMFYRSRRAIDEVARNVEAQYGRLDAASVEALLAEPDLVDQSDSMNAVVLEPAAGLIHSALGEEPATAAPFETVDLNEAAP